MPLCWLFVIDQPASKTGNLTTTDERTAQITPKSYSQNLTNPHTGAEPQKEYAAPL